MPYTLSESKRKCRMCGRPAQDLNPYSSASPESRQRGVGVAVPRPSVAEVLEVRGGLAARDVGAGAEGASSGHKSWVGDTQLPTVCKVHRARRNQPTVCTHAWQLMCMWKRAKRNHECVCHVRNVCMCKTLCTLTQARYLGFPACRLPTPCRRRTTRMWPSSRAGSCRPPAACCRAARRGCRSPCTSEHVGPLVWVGMGV